MRLKSSDKRDKPKDALVRDANWAPSNTARNQLISATQAALEELTTNYFIKTSVGI